MPQILNEPIFERAFEQAEIANYTPAQRTAYEMSRLSYLTTKAAFDTAKEDGREDEKVEVAQRMKAMKMPTEIIIQISGLTEEEINKIP